MTHVLFIDFVQNITVGDCNCILIKDMIEKISVKETVILIYLTTDCFRHSKIKMSLDTPEGEEGVSTTQVFLKVILLKDIC